MVASYRCACLTDRAWRAARLSLLGMSSERLTAALADVCEMQHAEGSRGMGTRGMSFGGFGGPLPGKLVTRGSGGVDLMHGWLEKRGEKK